MPRILRDIYARSFSYLVVAVNVPQKQNLSRCPPISHFSLKLYCISKYRTEISKTGPLHTFCINLLWGLTVSARADMVRPSPHLNCVSSGITLSNFHSWQTNPAPLDRCMFAQCFNTVLQFLFYPKNCFVFWLHDHLLEIQVPAAVHKLQLPQNVP